MNNSVEKLAKTVDEAIEEALADLGIASEDAIIEVLDEGDPGGLLGFGRRPARVRVTAVQDMTASEPDLDHEFAENSSTEYSESWEEEVELEPASDQAYPYDAEYEDENEDAGEDYASDYDADQDGSLDAEDYADYPVDEDLDQEMDLEDQEPRSQSRHAKQKAAEYSPEEKAVLEDKAVEFVANILQNLGIHGRISSFYADDGSLQIDVSGDDLGNAIGRRGETLDAIQYLTTLAINQDHDRYQRIYLDIDYYRDRQMKQLRQKARKSAEKVLKSGRPYVMNPMPPAERRQIHLALADFQGITTYSEGQEPRRSVVISRDDDKKARRNNH